MKIRHDLERVGGTMLMRAEPVSFVDHRVMLFAHGSQFRLLAPALNRVPETVEVTRE